MIDKADIICYRRDVFRLGESIWAGKRKILLAFIRMGGLFMYLYFYF